MSYKIISSIQELKDACLSQQGDYVHFRMSLAGGLACSHKRICFDPIDNTFSVINEIDESCQDDLTEDQIRHDTLILEAIEKKLFFQSLL